MALTVDKRACPQNHRCPMLRVCPEQAISQQGFAAPVIDAQRCLECGQCVSYCPRGAVREG